jgi:glucose-1-phosphate adenylyltransferase
MGARTSVIAIVQAGGQGSRMDVLTRERAKPALPFASAYRLVDFALSSLGHSGIVDVWLSVQYQAASLDPHVAGGRPWDLDRTRGGFRRVVPEEGAGGGVESGFSQGNADDLLRMRDEIEHSRADVVVVLSADHVFALDIAQVVDAHVGSGADCTLVTAETSRSEARHNVVVHAAADGRVSGVDVKPSSPSATTVATEIFVYGAESLVRALDSLRRELAHEADGEDSGLGDFGEHLLPWLIAHGEVRAFPLGRYWKDVGRPEAYLAAHRDYVAGRVDALADRERPVMTRSPDRAPGVVRAGAEVEDSVVGVGCDVRGRVGRCSARVSSSRPAPSWRTACSSAMWWSRPARRCAPASWTTTWSSAGEPASGRSHPRGARGTRTSPSSPATAGSPATPWSRRVPGSSRAPAPDACRSGQRFDHACA